MHGLVNRSIEGFVRASYGHEAWERIARTAGVDPEGFLTWAPSEDRLTATVLAVTARLLRKSVGECLEDLGAWLTRQEEIRRLLRFSGSDYHEFLESLRELPGRIAMVIPDMEIPALSVTRKTDGIYVIRPGEHRQGFMQVTAGIVRGMADDYGALALIAARKDRITVDVAMHDFADQRCFSLNPDTDQG